MQNTGMMGLHTDELDKTFEPELLLRIFNQVSVETASQLAPSAYYWNRGAELAVSAGLSWDVGYRVGWDVYYCQQEVETS